MTRTRLADLTRGALALVTLLTLIAGPPAALATAVGWPLPTSVPSLEAIEDAARSGVSDQLVIKVLATIAWIAWLQIAAAVTVEIVALVRRRPTRHLPILPGLQPTVAKLAAAALLLAAAASSRMPHAAAQPASPPPAPAPPIATVVTTPTAAAPVAEAPATTATVTVERHDSYWAIAERALGDGFRWREIRDANVGRTMPDGHVIAHGSDLVRPGWILEVPTAPLPTDAPAPAPLLVPTGTEVTVQAGDGFWDIAEEQVEAQLGRAATDDEVRPYWAALVDNNRDRLVDPRDPNLLFTGQHLALVGPPSQTAVPAPAPMPDDQSTDVPPPATASTMPATTAPPPAAPITSAPTADPMPAPPTDATQLPTDDTDDGSPSQEIAVAGLSALLAVGAARSLAMRRRRRAHLRVVADKPTSPQDAEIHREILVSADSEAVESLESGLVQLSRSLHDAELATAPVVIQHGGGNLDVYVDPPAPPPPGWVASDGSNAVWTADISAAPPVDGSAPCPAPLLVTLGQPDDGGQLYLDLEAARLVALTGDDDVVRDITRTMVADLALSPLASTIDIIVVGDLGASTAELDHVRTVPDWTAIANDVDAWVTQTHDALRANGWPSAFVARAADPDHDALAPLAVVATEPPPAELLGKLGQIDPFVAAVVVAGHDVPGALRIECSRDRLNIPSIGLEATPHPVDVASLDEIVALLDDPADDIDQGDPTLFDLGEEVGYDGERSVEPEVVVRVLGEIGVDDFPNLTAKQTAVLAFVALHGTVAAERIENAVWVAPSTTSRRKRLQNTVSEIRAAIGREHLPAAADGRYTTGPAVATDAHLFDRLVRQAASEPAEAACVTLRAALDVVTGPVFTYRDVDKASFTWVDLENLVSTWELRIAAVAERCADLYIDLGKPSDAAEVANRALTLIPTHTGITEALMRAHAANGDRLAVQRVFQAHASALEQLEIDDVADSTTELYGRLSQRSG